MKAEVEERVVQRKGVAGLWHLLVRVAGAPWMAGPTGSTPGPALELEGQLCWPLGLPKRPLPGCPTNSGLSWVGNPTLSEALPRSLFLPLFSCGAPENVESPSQHILFWRLALRGRPRMESWFLLFIHCAILGKLLTPTHLSFLICKMGTTPPSLTGLW